MRISDWSSDVCSSDLETDYESSIRSYGDLRGAFGGFACGSGGSKNSHHVQAPAIWVLRRIRQVPPRERLQGKRRVNPGQAIRNCQEHAAGAGTLLRLPYAGGGWLHLPSPVADRSTS